MSLSQPTHLHLTAVGQLLPIIVDLLLAFAIDHQRDRLVEFEARATVQGEEALTFELEGADRHAVLGPRAGPAVARNADDLRILENRSLELHGRFGIIVDHSNVVIFCFSAIVYPPGIAAARAHAVASGSPLAEPPMRPSAFAARRASSLPAPGAPA